MLKGLESLVLQRFCLILFHFSGSGILPLGRPCHTPDEDKTAPLSPHDNLEIHTADEGAGGGLVCRGTTGYPDKLGPSIIKSYNSYVLRSSGLITRTESQYSQHPQY